MTDRQNKTTEQKAAGVDALKLRAAGGELLAFDALYALAESHRKEDLAAELVELAHYSSAAWIRRRDCADHLVSDLWRPDLREIEAGKVKAAEEMIRILRGTLEDKNARAELGSYGEHVIARLVSEHGWVGEDV